MPKQLLFVDDDPNVLNSYRRTLANRREGWELTLLESPLDAWDRLLRQPVDLVVTDWNMPGMDGLQLLERMQTAPAIQDIPVILVTGRGEHGLRRRALESGATDLLEKPVDAADLTARICSALRLKSFQDELKLQNTQLEHRVRLRTSELEQSRLEMIRRLAKAAEFRDQETGNHVIRVGLYSRLIAETLSLDAGYIDTLALTAPLHDLGKIGIPDSILLKPGPLTLDERETMQQHCVIGARILRGEDSRPSGTSAPPDEAWFQSVVDPSDRSTLRVAASIALTHHEKWDGSGYPQGRRGKQIPIEGRIVALADVFDALMSRRPYKRSFSEEETLAILSRDVGAHFDPDVYAAFVQSFDRILTVRQEFNDHAADVPATAAT